MSEVLESFVVYGVFDPRDNRCRYVGITSNTLRDRIYGHRTDSLTKRKDYPINRFFQKHGCDADMFKILEFAEEGDTAHLRTLERFWIAQMRELGMADLNILDGGEGAFGYKRSQEMKDHMRQVMKTMWLDPDYREKAIARTKAGKAAMTPERLAQNERDLPRGSARPIAKLNETQVEEILRRLVAGERVNALSREYGVHHMSISNIRRGKTWRHVERPEGM